MIEHAYIHIPFCKRKCKYCSFVSGVNIAKKEIYIDALIKEIKNRYNNELLKSLYLGGGTPSLLEFKDINRLLECFRYSDESEITIEINPETVDYKKMIEYKNIGINRVSLGIQTFNDDILNIIGREHSGIESKKSIDIIKSAGFENISIDLIYGLPYQTIDIFKTDLEQAKKLNVPHISTYGLKIEEGSFFYRNRPENIPDDEIQSNMYKFLCDYLNEFIHYEISNFAKEGFESCHNYAYWLNKEYYGFGLNASGYENNIRYRNISIFDEYIRNPFLKDEEHELTNQEIMENEIFLALRLKQGINIPKINTKFNIDFLKRYENILNKYLDLKLIELTNKSIKLNREGILLSNEIMSEFIEI